MKTIIFAFALGLSAISEISIAMAQPIYCNYIDRPDLAQEIQSPSILIGSSVTVKDVFRPPKSLTGRYITKATVLTTAVFAGWNVIDKMLCGHDLSVSSASTTSNAWLSR